MARGDRALTVNPAGATVTSDELPVVVCDVNQIERVFQNLVGNAIKFRGEVPPEVHIGVRSTDSGWEFCVRDNGMGIAPEDSERVFKLFERLASGERYSGTGMGLTISKRIVERHGGTMWVEETPGGGATIAFTLARLEPSQPDVA